jgi:UDP-3-O-[3-hydroxymyristoyl] N-acetylglucosamine deacetylase
VQRVRLEGFGLHSGAACAIELERAAGEVAFRHEQRVLTRRELSATRLDLGVELTHADSGFRVDLVEHLFGALGGLGVHSGVLVTVHGPEIPLLDGGARQLTTAIASLDCPRERPALFIAEAAVVQTHESTYEFAPGDDVRLAVETNFAGVGVERAEWDGSAESFVRDIAPARTFGFARDADRLRARGRAVRVDLRAVMVLDDDGRVLPPGEPERPHELARHKLLDLVGDAYSFGGPPLGSIRASRPGHRANHAAMAEAIATGIVKRLD